VHLGRGSDGGFVFYLLGKGLHEGGVEIEV
jgi:hypothetical protein